MADGERRFTLIVVPHGGNVRDRSTRSYELSYTWLRWAAIAAGIVVLLIVVMGISWIYVAAQAARVPGLTRQLDRLEGERERVTELATSLAELQERYDQVRSMLGADGQRDSADLYLPTPSEMEGRIPNEEDSLAAALPTAWPLASRGFITREHLGEVPGKHPGIDIAVAEGSQVLAAGAGVITAAGEDPVYGKYVRIRHRDGYETMYGHASRIFVTPDERVAQNQVVALSGNTGTSTAPHLHFEIHKGGEPIDPRAMIRSPN